MIIYVDSECRCHTTNSSGLFREFDVSFFDGKCNAFIEGYRFVPAGEMWTREDGVTFTGEMIAPYQDYVELDAAQREYERQTIADMKAALALLGVTVNE